MSPDERLAQLDHMLANLQQHIDERAAELARPIIAEAHAAASDDVKSAQDKQQRAEDLVTELRRQLATLERHNQRYQGRAGAIRLLHPPVTYEGRKRCGTCSEAPWPCRTIRALDHTPGTS